MLQLIIQLGNQIYILTAGAFIAVMARLVNTVTAPLLIKLFKKCLTSICVLLVFLVTKQLQQAQEQVDKV